MLHRAHQVKGSSVDNSDDDLHIDRIDEEWKDREHWLQGGLESFRLAETLRDRHEFRFTVGLGFSLKSAERFTGVDFQQFKELLAKLDWTSPSLCLFEPGNEPWIQIVQLVQDGAAEHGAFVQEMDQGFYGNVVRASGCFYMEFRKKKWKDYYRSLFLEG